MTHTANCKSRGSDHKKRESSSTPLIYGDKEGKKDVPRTKRRGIYHGGRARWESERLKRKRWMDRLIELTKTVNKRPESQQTDERKDRCLAERKKLHEKSYKQPSLAARRLDQSSTEWKNK